MMFKLKSMPFAICCAIASGALATIATSPALAQQTTTDEAAPVQRVVVTGSYINRAGKETPSPVQVLTADDLKKSGYTSVSDVLRNITANGQGTLAQGFNRAFSGGASGVSLRGLTVGATLVLIDGHRMAPYPLSDDGQRPFVDISNIPFDAVERIDILKDGASAAYGSDAIAGVVNVILKKSFVGTAATAEGGTSQQGGGSTWHAAITHGFGDLEKDGYTAYGSIEYRHQNSIMLTQRSGKDWTRTNWSAEGGEDLTPGAVNALTSLPRTYQPYLYNPAGAGGVTSAANYAFYPGGCNFTALRANQCTFTDPWAQIQPQTENINVLGSFIKNLGNGWELNVKASMLESKDMVEIAPVAYPAGSYNGNTALGPGVIPHQVGVINPFLVPATYPGNTLGAPARVYGYLTDIGGRVDNIDSKSYRLVAELTGSIGGWDIAASAGYTRINTNQQYHGYVDRTALYAALTSPTNPYKITGGNSAAANAAVAPVFDVTQTDQLNFVEARGTRELMALGGGPLTFSGGASFVQKKLHAPDAAEFASGRINGNTAYAMGSQNDVAGYFELYAPVTKTLELDAAGRIDHYNTYGNSSTPKFGFKFTPSPAIALRGTYARGFRAPGPAENGTAGSLFGFNQVNDPLLCPGGSTTAAGNVAAFCLFSPSYVQTTSPDLKPEKSKSATLGLILEPVKGWSTTLDLYQIEVSNQIVTAASLPGYVPAFVRGVPVPQIISDGAGGTYTATPAYGPILYATSGYVNAGATKTSGFDVDTVYKFKMGSMGSLKTGLNWTHLMSYTLSANGIAYQLAGTHGPTVISGDTGNPKDRAQLTLSYDVGGLNVTSTVNWIGSFSVLDPSTGPGLNDTCENSLQNSNTYFASATYPTKYCRVKSFTSADLTVTYKVDPRWTVHATVLNLFNKQPPVDAQTYGGTSIASNTNAPYNPSLHQAGAIGRFFSVGAAYRF
jgi:iron complex outermembrane receptor protein